MCWLYGLSCLHNFFMHITHSTVEVSLSEHLSFLVTVFYFDCYSTEVDSILGSRTLTNLAPVKAGKAGKGASATGK